MDLIYLENIPDTIVRDDLIRFFQCSKSEILNYKHIFNKIGEGDIFYPACSLYYPKKEEIRLYNGYCDRYYNVVTYNIKDQKYIFSYKEGEIEKERFSTKLWDEMYEYIHKYFYLNC